MADTYYKRRTIKIVTDDAKNHESKHFCFSYALPFIGILKLSSLPNILRF